ncbi:MAG TPA: PAS domain-containing protein, partial [Thermomicrobiales bacterium]|nr:PAS domain-containing protein [Thermomicrobiales bacterium]
MPTDADPGREQADRPNAPAAAPLLAMQSRVLEMIAAGAELDAILGALCRLVEAQTPEARCAVGVMDDDGASVRLRVGPSLPPPVAAALADAPFGRHRHAPGNAAETAIVDAVDVASDSDWADRRALAATHGIRGCWSVPIRERSDGATLGALACFVGDSAPPAADAADLLRRAADLAALVIRHDRDAAGLRDAEIRYRTLVEQLPAIIYIEQLTGDVDLYLSPQVEPMLGYGAADLMAGKPAWRELVHPDDQAWVEAAVRRSDATGRFDEAYRMTARDGSIVWIRNQAIRVEDEHGQPRYWHGVVSDLTERKQAEERLSFLA